MEIFSKPDQANSDRIRSQKQQTARTKSNDFAVQNIALASQGKLKVQAALEAMTGFKSFSTVESFKQAKSLTGAKIAVGMCINRFNANLILSMIELGATVRWTTNDMGSTDVMIFIRLQNSDKKSHLKYFKDDVAAYMADCGVPIFGWNNLSEDDIDWCSKQCLFPSSVSWRPNIILETGGFLVRQLKVNQIMPSEVGFKGVVESSIWGIKQLEAMAKDNELNFPALNLYKMSLCHRFLNPNSLGNFSQLFSVWQDSSS